MKTKRYWYWTTVIHLVRGTYDAIDVQAGVPELVGILLGYKVYGYELRVWGKNYPAYQRHEAAR